MTDITKRIKLLREVLELDQFWSQPARQLSLGQRMRGEPACFLVGARRFDFQLCPLNLKGRRYLSDNHLPESRARAAFNDTLRICQLCPLPLFAGKKQFENRLFIPGCVIICRYYNHRSFCGFLAYGTPPLQKRWRMKNSRQYPPPVWRLFSFSKTP